MNEQQALDRMIPPGKIRPSKPYRGGVIQIWTTRACDKACFGCTQGSNLTLNIQLQGKNYSPFITPEQYKQAVISLKGYFGVVGTFGGNPATHPQFEELCSILRKHIPYEQRGLWCNNPLTQANAKAMRATFNPAVSNLNVHLDRNAYDLFQKYWPESHPFGLTEDSRHSPPFVAMKDVIGDEGKRWELISKCPINQHWSAMIGVFRGQLRAWFCEVAGAQAMLHQYEEDYPDTGLSIVPTEDEIEQTRKAMQRAGRSGEPDSYYSPAWWELPMDVFTEQVRKHCHECSIPLQGYGELAQADTHLDGHGPKEQTSVAHAAIYKPKRQGRTVEVVTDLVQLNTGRISSMVKYLQNSHL